MTPDSDHKQEWAPNMDSREAWTPNICSRQACTPNMDHYVSATPTGDAKPAAQMRCAAQMRSYGIFWRLTKYRPCGLFRFGPLLARLTGIWTIACIRIYTNCFGIGSWNICQPIPIWHW